MTEPSSNSPPILYGDSPQNNQSPTTVDQPITYGDCSNLGGSRIARKLKEEYTYPLTIQDYLIIKGRIQTHILDNNQSILASISCSFLLAAIGHYSTTKYFIKDVNGVNIGMDITAIAIFSAFVVVFLGCLLALIVTLLTKSSTDNPFKHLDESIRTSLGIHDQIDKQKDKGN